MPHTPFPHPGGHPWPGGPHPLPFPQLGRYDVVRGGVILGSYPTAEAAEVAIASGMFGVQSAVEPITVVPVL